MIITGINRSTIHPVHIGSFQLNHQFVEIVRLNNGVKILFELSFEVHILLWKIRKYILIQIGAR